MVDLFEKMIAVHEALAERSLPHAFGGALALAFCTAEPRGTRDIDINIFVPAQQAERVLAALPEGVTANKVQVDQLTGAGQTRLDWDGVPLDIFLNNHPLHEVVSRRVQWVTLGGRELPMLDCAALVVFKALFNRNKDWGDVDAVAATAPAAVANAADILAEATSDADETVVRLRSVARGL